MLFLSLQDSPLPVLSAGSFRIFCFGMGLLLLGAPGPSKGDPGERDCQDRREMRPNVRRVSEAGPQGQCKGRPAWEGRTGELGARVTPVVGPERPARPWRAAGGPDARDPSGPRGLAGHRGSKTGGPHRERETRATWDPGGARGTGPPGAGGRRKPAPVTTGRPGPSGETRRRGATAPPAPGPGRGSRGHGVHYDPWRASTRPRQTADVIQLRPHVYAAPLKVGCLHNSRAQVKTTHPPCCGPPPTRLVLNLCRATGCGCRSGNQMTNGHVRQQRDSSILSGY
ncbi:unnamed protein product [Arctogadus glacialis]